MIYSHYSSNRNILSRFFKTYIQRGTNFKAALIAFFIGLSIIIIPLPSTSIGQLPQTGEEKDVLVSLAVDKENVERDNPDESGRTINYTVQISNNQACKRKPLDVVIVYDASGSMDENKASMRDAVSEFLATLNQQEDRVGILTYGSDEVWEHPLTKDYSSVEGSLNEVVYGGLTNLGQALNRAQQMLKGSSAEVVKVMVVITDGRSNVPDGPFDQTYVYQAATNAKEEGTLIVSIGAGLYIDSQLLNTISSSNSYYPTSTTRKEFLSLITSMSGVKERDLNDVVANVDISKYDKKVSVSSISSGGVFSDGKIQWNIGVVQCKETLVHRFTLTPTESAVDLDEISLNVEVQIDGSSILSSNVATTIIHAPIVDIEFSNDVDTAFPGDKLKYDAVIKNKGTGKAYDIVLTDNFESSLFSPDDASLSGAGSVFQGMIVLDNNGEKYVLGGIDNPGQNMLTFSVQGSIPKELSPGIYTLVHTLGAHGSRFDYVKADSTRIEYAPDIVVQVVAPAEKVYAKGDEVSYKVLLKNNGSYPAKQVRLSADFDTRPVLVSDSGQGEVLDHSIVWYFEQIDLNETIAIDFKLKLLDVGDVKVKMLAQNGDVPFDTDIADNTSENLIKVVEDAFITVKANLDRVSYTAGDNQECVFMIVNEGSIDAENVTLIVNNFAESTLVEERSSHDVITSGENLFVNLGEIKSEENAEVLLVFNVNERVPEGTYPLGYQAKWVGKDGLQLSSGESEHVVTIVAQNRQGIDIPSDIRVMRESRTPLFDMLPETGEPLSMLKVVLGVGLALPLPIMIIFDVNRNKGKMKFTSKAKKIKQR